MPNVLVVDDEVALLNLMRRYLERIGYSVEIRSDSLESLSLIAEEPGRFQLVIVDLSLPRLSGRDLVTKIVEINPETRVLICSGEPFDCRTILHGYPDRVRFLQKPFAAQMFAAVVEELVPSKAAASK